MQFCLRLRRKAVWVHGYKEGAVIRRISERRRPLELEHQFEYSDPGALQEKLHPLRVANPLYAGEVDRVQPQEGWGVHFTYRRVNQHEGDSQSVEQGVTRDQKRSTPKPDGGDVCAQHIAETTKHSPENNPHTWGAKGAEFPEARQEAGFADIDASDWLWSERRQRDTVPTERICQALHVVVVLGGGHQHGGTVLPCPVQQHIPKRRRASTSPWHHLNKIWCSHADTEGKIRARIPRPVHTRSWADAQSNGRYFGELESSRDHSGADIASGSQSGNTSKSAGLRWETKSFNPC